MRPVNTYARADRRKDTPLSRLSWWLCAIAASLGASASAQELEAQQAVPPERIDLTIERGDDDEPVYENCSDEQEAAIISGEIIVCRRRSADGPGYDAEAARRRYAERTMNRGNPQAPDLFGIPNHGPVVARGCFIGPCPPAPIYYVDVEALPEAPPGSDADRIARGLPPLEKGAQADGTVADARIDELGLPDPVSPSGSASPEGAQ